ncbi:MAG TPA: GNAT family N-acetyltransferase [bacterium]|nr:GNAT family N-acetyltransferase [bacterium]
MGPEADLVKPRFARGCRCFAVLLGGAVAGYGWLSTGPEWIGELQLEIRPGKAEGYVWNCVTLAGHRRKGIFRSVVLGISEAARQSGVKRLWIGSLAIPAEKALAPAGFRPAMRFTRFGAAGMHFMRVWAIRGDALGTNAERVLRVKAGVYARPSRRVRH